MARLHDIPRWLVCLTTLAVFVGTSLLGLMATRRWSRRRGLHALVDNAVIGWVFSAILGIYAIAIGLIAVESWGNAAAATGVASHEAAEIAALHRDLSGYPEPLQSKLEAGLASYTHYVIEEAWPQQRRGEIPRGGTLILDDFEHLLYAFEPTTEGQKAIHAEALRAFNTLIEFRRQRLEAVNYAVPGTLWSVVLIGLLVFFILITDLPYRGEASVGPESYQLVLHDLIEARPGR